jgi:hypothetical protein
MTHHDRAYRLIKRNQEEYEIFNTFASREISLQRPGGRPQDRSKDRPQDRPKDRLEPVAAAMR